MLVPIKIESVKGGGDIRVGKYMFDVLKHHESICSDLCMCQPQCIYLRFMQSLCIMQHVGGIHKVHCIWL